MKTGVRVIISNLRLSLLLFAILETGLSLSRMIFIARKGKF